MLGFGSLTGGADEVARGRVDMEFDSSKVDAGLRSMESKLGSSMRALGRIAKYGGLAIAGGIAFGTAAVVKMGFEFDNMRQQAQVAFTTMLGSGKKATAFLDRLQKFAAKTPFEFTDLTRASQRLLAMGFNAKQIIPTLTNLGNAAAGLGASKETIDRLTLALGQMNAKGLASGEEMRQLVESGIPAWKYLADTLKVDVATAMEMVTKREVDSGIAIKSLMKGMEHDFPGMMEKQSHTWGGLLSTIKDTFAQLSGTVMRPFFEMATDGLQQIVDFVSKPSFTRGVETFAANMERFFNQPWEIKVYMAQQAARDLARRATDALQEVDWEKVADTADRWFSKALNFGTDNANAFVEELIDHKQEITEFFGAILGALFHAATTKGGAELIGIAIGVAFAKKALRMLPMLILGGGGLGGAGRGLLGNKPVPVFVTNPGFGAGGAPVPGGGRGGVGGKLPAAIAVAGRVALPVAIVSTLATTPGAQGAKEGDRRRDMAAALAMIKGNPGLFPRLNELVIKLEGGDKLSPAWEQIAQYLAHDPNQPLKPLELQLKNSSINASLNETKEHVDQVTNAVLGIPKSTQDAMDRARAPITEHIDMVKRGFEATKGKVDDTTRSVDRLKQNIGSLRDKTVNVDVQASVTLAGIKFLPSGAIAHHLAEGSGFAEGGIVKAVPGGVYRVAEAGYDEAILSTDPRYKHRTYEIIGEIVRRIEGRRGLLPGFATGGIAGTIGRSTAVLGGQVAGYLAGRMRPMKAYSEARRMASLHQPYLWGGGHAGFSANGPWDCSGAVSQVLHAAGYPIGAPMVSGALAGWGRPGSSDMLEVLANATHTYMRIFDQSYGTSNENPGGGWGGPLSYGERSGFSSRIPGFAGGGIVNLSPLRSWGPGSFGVHGRRKGETRRHFLRRLHAIDVGMLPKRFQLARARAALTRRTEDDIEAQRHIVRWFRRGRGTKWLSSAQKINVLENLRSEADTLSSLLEQQSPRDEQAPRLAGIVQDLFSQYGGNIFGPGMSIGSQALGAVTGGSTSGGTRGPGPGAYAPGGAYSGPRRETIVNQFFNQPPEDPYPLMRSAQFAADATFGG